MNPSDYSATTRCSLSLCMIVKDEAENISGCLDCIHDIADEMIIVDTGSSDSTVNIAKRYGADIFHSNWQDDFSAARNFSIAHATGRYILWLDADDRIDEKGRKGLAELKRTHLYDMKQAFSLLIVCRNSLGDAAVYYQTRIIPNINGICFKGRVHESLEPSLAGLGVKTVRKDIEIIHTGYDDSKGIQQKIQRNLNILLDEKEDSASDPVWCFKIAQCYFGLKDFDHCAEFLYRARDAGPHTGVYKSCYTMLSDCLLQLNRHQEADTLLKNALQEFPGSGYLNYLMGAARTLSRQYETGLIHFAAAQRLGIEIEGHPVLSDVDSRMRYFEGRCKEGLGRTGDALMDYDAALANCPHDPDILETRGLLLIRENRIQEGLKNLELARERCTRVNKRLWLTLAKIYQFAGQIDDAGNLYFELLDQNAADIDALSGMLTMGAETGRSDLFAFAIETLITIYKIPVTDPHHIHNRMPELFLQLSERMYADGNPENASRLADLGERFLHLN